MAGKRKAPQAESVVLDDGADGPDAPDPRVAEIAAELDALRVKRGLSKGHMARELKVHPTHMGKVLNGKTEPSMDVLLGTARLLGAAVIITESNEARPLMLGRISQTGRLMTDLQHLVFPSIVAIDAAFGPFKAGDQLHVRDSATFEVGRWVMIQRPDGERDLVQCDVRDGKDRLINTHGDAVDYEKARHRIIARVYGRFEQI